MSSVRSLQRRQLNRIHAQPVIQVGSEPSVRDRGLEIEMGGGDHAHVHLLVRDEPTRSNSPSCSTRRNLTWMSGGKVADLVEEDGAAVGQLEPALAHRDRAGEGALLVPEQLAFDQRRRQRRAVDPDERPGVAAAALVQRTGEQLLAGARRSQQQHGRVHRRDLRQARQRDSSAATLADDVVEIVVALDFFFQADVLCFEARVQPLDVRDAAPQRRLVPAALHREAKDVGNQLQPANQRGRPAPSDRSRPRSPGRIRPGPQRTRASP